MKYIALITTFALCTCIGYRAGCQSGGGFAGLKVGHYKPRAKKERPPGRRLSFAWQKKRDVAVNSKWSIGAELTFQKNTFEFAPDHGKLLGTYRAAVPLYASYHIDKRHTLEIGGYVGALCHSTNVFVTEFVRMRHLDYLTVRPDYGLVAGMSWRAGDLGSIKVRYNYGLNVVFPVSPEVTKRNRLLELGFVIGF